MVDLWLEVKDNDYYERRLERMPLVRDLMPRAQTMRLVDGLIHQSYLEMRKMLNKPVKEIWPSV